MKSAFPNLGDICENDFVKISSTKICSSEIDFQCKLNRHWKQKTLEESVSDLSLFIVKNGMNNSIRWFLRTNAKLYCFIKRFELIKVTRRLTIENNVYLFVQMYPSLLNSKAHYLLVIKTYYKKKNQCIFLLPMKN